MIRPVTRPLAIGSGLAEWAHSRPTREPDPRRRVRYWLLRFPLEMALSLLDVISDAAGRGVMSLFHVDDRGHVHVRDRFVAVVGGVLIALAVLVVQLIAVYSFDRGVAYGMQAQGKQR